MGTCSRTTDERPRERLLGLGAAALTDAELLAVLLRNGIAGKPALELARDMLTRFGDAPVCYPPRRRKFSRCADLARPRRPSSRQWSS